MTNKINGRNWEDIEKTFKHKVKIVLINEENLICKVNGIEGRNDNENGECLIYVDRYSKDGCNAFYESDIKSIEILD